MRSLALKLTFCFLIVSLTGAALSATFARVITSLEYSRLVSDQFASQFAAAAAAYYSEHGSWSGVPDGAELLQALEPGGLPGYGEAITATGAGALPPFGPAAQAPPPGLGAGAARLIQPSNGAGTPGALQGAQPAVDGPPNVLASPVAGQTSSASAWAAVAQLIGVTNKLKPASVRPELAGPFPAQPAPPPGGAFPFALVDADSRVVVPAGAYVAGELVPAVALAGRGVPVDLNGRRVATVLPTGDPLALDANGQRYLQRTNQALIFGGLGATAVALAIGAFLASTLTRPLRELTNATLALAGGRLGHQVPVRSRDELGELAASFNRMSRDLARANDQRRQMTADIAHELRTPLTVITGYIEALRDGVLKPTSARFDAMYNEAQHLKRLVEDLRTLSLADAGELALVRQPTGVAGLVDRLAAAFAHQAERQGIALHVVIEDGLPPVRVDPERVLQVLENLLGNALCHTPAGGEITVSASAVGGAPGTRSGVSLAVRDSGEGIAPDVLPRVFDRFYRGDPSRSQESGGSGLGLAIAKAIIEAHGGEISASSAGLGQGSTFTVWLPEM